MSSDVQPSRDSVFVRMKSVGETSSSKFECVKRVAGIFLGTLGCTICLGIFLAIPISMIVIGALYLHQCPVQRFIPIYLIVGGCFGLVKNLAGIGQKIKNDLESSNSTDIREDKNTRTNPFDMILNCFLLAWFITGNVWVYGTRDWVAEPTTAANYCHPTCYYFAFWMITSSYILLGVIFVCVFIGGIIAICCAACCA